MDCPCPADVHTCTRASVPAIPIVLVGRSAPGGRLSGPDPCRHLRARTSSSVKAGTGPDVPPGALRGDVPRWRVNSGKCGKVLVRSDAVTRNGFPSTRGLSLALRDVFDRCDSPCAYGPVGTLAGASRVRGCWGMGPIRGTAIGESGAPWSCPHSAGRLPLGVLTGATDLGGIVTVRGSSSGRVVGQATTGTLNRRTRITSRPHEIQGRVLRSGRIEEGVRVL